MGQPTVRLLRRSVIETHLALAAVGDLKRLESPFLRVQRRCSEEQSIVFCEAQT